MTIALEDVRDKDCIESFDPVTFDDSARIVTGAAAILRRILYRWCIPAGFLDYDRGLGVIVPLTELEGYTLSPQDLAGYIVALEREAAAVDFVRRVNVTGNLAGGSLRIRARVVLVDGLTYPLEVNAAGAATALVAIGA
jgi:hypothetical protein